MIIEKLIKMHPNLRDLKKTPKNPEGLINCSLHSKHIFTNSNQLIKSYATTPISSFDTLTKHKLQSILDNTTKFTKLKKNTIESLKSMEATIRTEA